MMARITRNEIEEVIDFVIEHHTYKEEDVKTIRYTVAQHAAYDTLIIVRDDDEQIIAICRWNVLPTGQDAVILDTIIHPKWRKKNMLWRITAKGKQMYPALKYIIYERYDKGKPFKKYSIQRLLNRRF